MIRNRLQELRWERNWSQSQLSRISGVPQPDIHKIENNPTSNPGVYTAIRLSKALSVPIEEIFVLD